MGGHFAVSLCVGIGLLGFGGSIWNGRAAASGAEPEIFDDFLRSSPWNQWSIAVADALDRGRPLAVLCVTSDAPCLGLAQSLAEAARDGSVLQAALDPFVPALLRIDGTPAERAAADALGLDRAPLIVVVAAEGPSPTIVDGARCTTGALPEPFSVAAELLRVSRGDRASDAEDELGSILSARSLGRGEAADAMVDRAIASEPSINGLFHRLRRLDIAYQGAWRTEVQGDGRPQAADAEGPVEAELLLNDDERLLYLGWSALATTFERYADAAAESPGDEHLGAPLSSWERRLRDATRRAWIGCDPENVPAFGMLLIQRYCRSPNDLDSLDRAFLGAVVRAMAKEIEEDGPLVAWLHDARAKLSSLK